VASGGPGRGRDNNHIIS